MPAPRDAQPPQGKHAGPRQSQALEVLWTVPNRPSHKSGPEPLGGQGPQVAPAHAPLKARQLVRLQQLIAPHPSTKRLVCVQHTRALHPVHQRTLPACVRQAVKGWSVPVGRCAFSTRAARLPATPEGRRCRSAAHATQARTLHHTYLQEWAACLRAPMRPHQTSGARCVCMHGVF